MRLIDLSPVGSIEWGMCESALLAPVGSVEWSMCESALLVRNCHVLPYWEKNKKPKMMYAPRNEFCMIWVIFWMPTDQVMAFLCFISDNQSVDMSGQGWVGGRGGHN